MKYFQLAFLAALLNLGGCATIITGDSESVAISTTPVKGATCEVSNKRGKWTVDETPGNVEIKRSMSDLNIACKTKDGYIGEKKISTSIKSTAAGNLLFGGFIGGGVDAATGAAFDYPDNIEVTMKNSKNNQA